MSCLSPTYSNCIYFSEDLKKALKSKGFTSTNLEEFIIELIGKESLSSRVANLETVVNSIGADTLPAKAKTFGLKSGSVDAIQLINRSVDYSIDDEELTYNFSKLIDELPEGMVYLGARVDVVDDKGKRASIRGKRNVLPVKIPSTINFAIDLKSANGNLELTRSIRAEGNATDKSAILNVRDLTTGVGDLTIQQHLEALSSDVALLKQRT